MKILKFPLGAMGTNCYILIDAESGTAAVADPGYNAEYIYEKLTARSLKCECILLTHGHFDHMTALGELRRLTGAPLYMHGADAPALADPELSYMRRFGGLELTFEPPEQVVSDGDIIRLGGSVIEVMHTPGHTPGSVCYLIRGSENLMLSGDTLFRDDIGRYDLIGGDFDVLKKSLERIAALDGDWTVYPGHGPTTKLSREREMNIYLN